MVDRFATTTRNLRASAADQLLARGARAFSIEAVARGADVAVGTVYERWNDRLDLLADTVGEMLLPRVRDAVAVCVQRPVEERLAYLLDSEDGRGVLLTTAEIVFAARDHHDLIPLANEALAALDVGIVSGTELQRGPLWWATSLCVGWGVLKMGRIDLPPMADDVARVLRGSGGTIQPRREARVEAPPTPWVDADQSDDGLSVRILSTARDMLSDGVPGEFSARGVAREAGVSVNALYRRYGSRADIIRGVLLNDMHEQRFAWSNELIDVLIDANPVNRAVETIARVLDRVHSDQREAQRLLEITVAARTNEAVRTQIVEHIESAVAARAELVRRLQDAGVIARPPGAENLSWFIQTVPIGVRLLASIGRVAPAKTTLEGLRHACSACLVSE